MNPTSPTPEGGAWQPVTFRGVATFAQATLGRLLLVQLIVAMLVAGAVGWFLSIDWFPEIRKAIRRMPDSGAIQSGLLSTPRETPAPLVETRHLCIAVDAADTGVASSLADVRIEFHRTNWAICGFAGCIRRPYPAAGTIPFNRPDAASWWGAWQPMLFGLVSIGVVAALFLSWLTLATLGFPVAWLIAYFKDRRLSTAGAWKLAGASLMPGALLTALGLVLYGLGIVDLVRLLVLWLAHIPVGWLYLAAAPLRLPRVVVKVPADPFGTSESKPENPFVQAK